MPAGLGTAVSAAVSGFASLLIDAMAPGGNIYHIGPDMDQVTKYQLFMQRTQLEQVAKSSVPKGGGVESQNLVNSASQVAANHTTQFKMKQLDTTHRERGKLLAEPKL